MVKPDVNAVGFPRRVTFEIRYFQRTTTEKKLMEATLTLDSYDSNSTQKEYQLTFSFVPISL